MPGPHLAEQHRALVFKLAHTWARKFPSAAGLDVEDLAQEGFLELTKAAPKYDATRGSETNFVTIVVRNRFYHLLTRSYDRWTRTIVTDPYVLEGGPGGRRSRHDRIRGLQVPPEQEVVGALHDSLRAGRLVVRDRYRRLRVEDLAAEADIPVANVMTAGRRRKRPGRTRR